MILLLLGKGLIFPLKMINFTNTQTRKKEQFKPLAEDKVTMYTCGPTVYNFVTIGNFRAFLSFELLKRWLTFRGFNVKHVMNITDVDDKTIRGSRENNSSLKEFTEKYTEEFWDDFKTLRIVPAKIAPKATEHIPQMIKLIETLIEKGNAYAADDGSVYFSIKSFKDYGKLSHLDKRELKTGARISGDEYEKDNASDFVLWKAWTENDGDVKWESPWGAGRPGWHLECSAMSQTYLGDTIDIHMGGEDLIFPHHENEIAQSEASSGKPFVNCWVHNGFLLVEGKKMSKSLGNYYTLRDIISKGWTGREVRYLLMSVHYRQQFNFTFDGLHAARSALQRLDDLRSQLDKLISEKKCGDLKKEVQESVEKARKNWIKSLDDDLNISPALGGMFELVKQSNKWFDEEKLNSADAEDILKFLDETDLVLDIKGGSDLEIPPKVLELAEERVTVRKEKNWARADEIRNELAELGYVVEDTPEGPRVKTSNQ